MKMAIPGIAVSTETKNRGILYLILLIERFRSQTFNDIELLALVLLNPNTANIQLQWEQAVERFTLLWREPFCACYCSRSLGGNRDFKQDMNGSAFFMTY